MTEYYADSVNGNNANGGTSWTDAKQTLTAVEDIPVAAGDTVHCRGVFRETLTPDVSGTAGNPITYRGHFSPDTGEMARWTGSDNDETATRQWAFMVNDKDYRTFQRFQFDLHTTYNIRTNAAPTHFIVEDCTFQGDVNRHIYLDDTAQNTTTIRRCLFMPVQLGNFAIDFHDGATGTVNAASTVENCIFLGGGKGIGSDQIGGISVLNSLFLGTYSAIRVYGALPGGFTAININNCLMSENYNALDAMVLGEIVENYNSLYGSTTARTNVAVGAQSNTKAILLKMPPMIQGFEYSWWIGKLNQWSSQISIAGTSVPTEDFFGYSRVGAPSSWGPIEYTDSPARRDWDAGYARGWK